MKTNVANSTLGLDFVNALRPVSFNWKADADMPEGIEQENPDNPSTEADTTTKWGLIAQEVKTAMDAAGATDFAGWSTDIQGIQGVNASSFVYPLLKAVQELSTELEAAKVRITELEN